MGRDKATLELEGVALQDRCVAVLRQCFEKVVVIAHDEVPGLGPIGGLLTALRQVETPAVFVVACDMPFLDADLVRQMAGELPGYDAVAFPDEPLHAAYATCILPVIERQIAARDYAMHRLLAKLRVKLITTPRPQALTNVNTPQEWELVKRTLTH